MLIDQVSSQSLNHDKPSKSMGLEPRVATSCYLLYTADEYYDYNTAFLLFSKSVILFAIAHVSLPVCAFPRGREKDMMSFGEWNDCVLSNCGHYYSTPVKKDRGKIGDFRMRSRHGIEIAQMDCRISRVNRCRAGIRRDDSEYLFLLLLKSGEVGVAHNGREEVMSPGDVLLMDSTRVAELHFDGYPASFDSVHLPRGMCLEGRKFMPDTGRRIGQKHPLHASLINLLVAGDNAADQSLPADYLLDFIMLMFQSRNPVHDASGFRNHKSRFRFICDILECHLDDSNFSIERLAALVHMSRRQLQRDFSDNGTTLTHFITEKRLQLVAANLRRAARLHRRPVISDMAYRAGFNDLSYFNRTFRRQFNCCPSQYYSDYVSTTVAHIGDLSGVRLRR
ncbi:MAG: helix-turn-helix domain-containing protein [Paracoccus sp. (in: a-proteobacteria)]